MKGQTRRGVWWVQPEVQYLSPWARGSEKILVESPGKVQAAGGSGMWGSQVGQNSGVLTCLGWALRADTRWDADRIESSAGSESEHKTTERQVHA